MPQPAIEPSEENEPGAVRSSRRRHRNDLKLLHRLVFWALLGLIVTFMLNPLTGSVLVLSSPGVDRAARLMAPVSRTLDQFEALVSAITNALMVLVGFAAFLAAVQFGYIRAPRIERHVIEPVQRLAERWRAFQRGEEIPPAKKTLEEAGRDDRPPAMHQSP